MDTTARTTDTTHIQPETGVLAVRQALAAFRTTTAPTIARLASETSTMRRKDLAAFIDELDATLGRIAEILTHLDGLNDRLPNAALALDEALDGLEYTGTALEGLHIGLTATAR